MIRFITALLIYIIGLFAYSNATHIVGGEINYKHLGNNFYEIRMTVYRDCYNGVPDFDDPASLGFFNMNNALVKELQMPFLGKDTIDPYIISPCLVPPIDVCYEVTTYIDTVFLPPIPGGYQLAYQRCCRNVTILNIQNPSNVGITIYAKIPDQTLYPVNSNPKFISLAPPFICAGAPFVWDQSAIDVDGDSISYELCTPYDGASTGNPQPVPPNPPPYVPVLWDPPYSLANIMGGVPMAIDPVTGILTATPANQGQFVVGVCANEYRNGVLISTTKRDFQINVVACPTLVVASMNVSSVICGYQSVNFQNNSFNASSYFWNFGDLSTNGDTSHATNPTYNYPDTGYYTVTLIAYSGTGNNCNDTVTKTIHLVSEYVSGFSYSIDTCLRQVNFTDTILSTGNYTTAWFWNLGNSNVSTQQNPVTQYTGNGPYTVSLITASNTGCFDTSTAILNLPSIIAFQNAIVENEKCNNDCTGKISTFFTGGPTPYTYQWSIPGLPNSNVIDSLCAGTYYLVVTDDYGCTATYSSTLTTPPLLTSTIAATDAYCGGACIGTATINPSGGTPLYNYLWNDNGVQTTSTAVDLCPGWYTAIVTDQNGCTSVDSVEVLFSNFIPPVDATADTTLLIIGQSTSLHAITSNQVTYAWSPSTGLSSTSSQNPVAQPNVTTTYTVIITDPNGCTNIDSVTIMVKLAACEEPEIYIPNAFSPNADGHNDIFIVRGKAVNEVHLEIYDRWGQKVFESNSPSSGWDGTFGGKQLAPAVFDYFIEITCFDKNRFFKKGNITLVR